MATTRVPVGWGLARLAACALAYSAAIAGAAAGAADAQMNSTDARVGRDGPLWLWDGKPMNGELHRVEASGSVTLLPVRRGLVEGTTRSRYADGRPHTEGAFSKGQPHGLHLAWWPNGRAQSEQNFADGMPHGRSRTWYASGKPYEEHHHARGQEAGPQRIWFEDGRLRANYEVKNGRRYGTIGAMGCVGGERAMASASKQVLR